MAYDYLLIAAASLVGLVVIAATALKGWQGWLELKTRELEQARGPDLGSAPGMARIEIADLKERIRKLEAIAAGVDL
ncbi:hypothetical protein ACFO0A_13210 [Novosphingobium tardum]|jgi:hypothetical protein|uniref:Phage shock protein B n=1 Tax=Novosphingobium tardum TaxID=1538021 RepID=A0ABV8RRI9_9SPHN